MYGHSQEADVARANRAKEPKNKRFCKSRIYMKHHYGGLGMP